MVRSALIALACLVGMLSGCRERAQVAPAPPKFVPVELPVGDRCLSKMKRRPDDCARGCMYADAVLYLSPGDAGSLSVTASPGGDVWWSPSLDKPRLPAMTAANPTAAAARLPEILAAL